MAHKILYIPHYPGYACIKNRSFIIARELSNYAEVYYVSWDIPVGKNLPSRIVAQIKNLGCKIQTDGKLKILRIPLLFRPGQSCLRYFFNEKVLNIAIKRLKISIVINAGMNLLRFAKIKSDVKVYDLVDDHMDANDSLNINSERLKRLYDDIRCADFRTAVTEPIRYKMRKRLNLDAILVPNGIDLTQQQLLSYTKLQKKANDPAIYGFIGNVHEKWVNMKLALDAFRIHVREHPRDKFLIIGGGDKAYLETLAKEYGCDGVEFVGPVEQNRIYEYFTKIDVGVIPFHINSFTENSLPIKALEYGCFGSAVISTPIEALKKFSFVHFGETVSEWQSLYGMLRRSVAVNRDELRPYLWSDIVKTYWGEHLVKLPEYLK